MEYISEKSTQIKKNENQPRLQMTRENKYRWPKTQR